MILRSIISSLLEVYFKFVSLFVRTKPDNMERPNQPMFIDPAADLKPQKGVMGDSWFICSNLDAGDREFGVLVHFIKKPLFPGTTTIAITDISGCRYFLDDGKKGMIKPTEDGFVVSSDILQWSANASTMRVQGKMESGDGLFDLALVRQGPVMAYNGTGCFPLLDNELATYEYAFPTMNVTGTITVNRTQHSVVGNGWFDRQWFRVAKAETLISGETRWMWISMRLSNGEIIGVWNATGKRERSWATILHPDGSQTIADVEPISKNQFGIWTSAKSGVKWPSEWTVIIPGVKAKLKVTSTSQGQETFANFHRIESVIHVEGSYAGQDVTGRGYGEIVGDPRIKQ